MIDDKGAAAGPSLLLAGAEKAHREHLHQHNLFHQNKRQTATDVEVQSVITEVVQTVSFVQQIDVDSNGSTFSIQTFLADSTGGQYVPGITDTSSPTTTPEAASPATTAPTALASSTVVSTSQSLPINESTTSTSSISSIPTSSFALLTVSSNSTTLNLTSSTLKPNFSNSTTTSSSCSSSFTYLSSSSLTSFNDSSYSTSYSVLYSTTSDSNATPTSAGGEGGGSGSGSGSASTATTSAGNGTNSESSSNTSTSTYVGSIVGSVAGAAIVIVLILFILRWRKRHKNMLSLASSEPSAGGAATRGIGPPPSGPSGGMSETRSNLFAVPGALASLTGFKRASRQTDQTNSTDAGGERGFYRVSGRKLPSVFQTGGDGYGDDVVDNTLSGSSFYRDSEGFYGGPSSPSLIPPFGTKRPESGIPVMRPSPARTPVTEHGFSTGPAPLIPPRRPDVLGRSHPSQDGSHASRFTEEV